MKIHDMATGKVVETTPEEFMKHIAPQIQKYKEFHQRLAELEEE